MAATSSVFGNWANSVQKSWKGNLLLNCFDSICLLNYQYNVMYSDYSYHTQQFLFQRCFHIFSKLWNITIYWNMHRTAMYRDPCIMIRIVL